MATTPTNFQTRANSLEAATLFAAEHPENDFHDKLIELIPFLRAFARSLCRHRAEADDLCQEALAKSWASRASFERGSNLQAWVFTILRNQFYSDKRRSWRTVQWDDTVDDQLLVTDGGQQAAVALSDLVRAFYLLSHEQREAIILVGAGGFTYDEAAEICGCALGTVKSRVARARVALDRGFSGSTLPIDPKRSSGGTAMNDILDQLERFTTVKPARSVQD